MRTLSEIIDSVQDNSKFTKEELRLALLVTERLLLMDHHSLRDIAIGRHRESEFFKKIEAQNSFDRFKRALAQDPKIWLGEDLPEKKEYQKRRSISMNIFSKFLEKEKKLK